MPAGAPITLDGRIDEAEWSDAFSVVQPLAEGKSLRFRLKRTGPWLALSAAATRPYSGETLRLFVADEFGTWITEVMFGLGMPQIPPATWRRAPPGMLTNVEPESPRGALVRLDVAGEASWGAECLFALKELGIGRGDRRAFRALAAVGNDREGALLALPEGVKASPDVSTYARFSSPDSWGATERWDPPDADASRAFDDAAVLFNLFREYQRFSQREEPDRLVISTAVHPRSLARIQELRGLLEDGRRRNPTLPAWTYFLGRLLNQANLFAEARTVIESVPAPLRSLDAFVTLEAEHHLYLQEWDQATEALARNPKAKGAEDTLVLVKQAASAWQEELRAREVDAAKVEKNPRIRIQTEKGAIDCELFEDEAPRAVRNFMDLVLKQKFYDRLRFHAVFGGTTVRAGDPRTRPGSTDTSGGPPWRLRRDPCPRHMFRGTLAMVPAEGGVLHGSEFSIAISPHLREEQSLGIFGRVIAGMEVVDSLEQDDKLLSIEVLERRNHAYDPQSARIR